MKQIIAIFTMLLLSVAVGVGVAGAAELQTAPTVLFFAAGFTLAGLNPVQNALGSLLTDLQKSSRNNMGGLRVILYFGKYDDVETWPTSADQESATGAMDSLAVLTGDVVMKTGKRMFELYATLGEIELKNTLVGPIDGQCFKQELSIKHPGLAAKLIGFQAATNNENLFFILERHNGTKYMMGAEGMPVMKTKDDGGSGKKIEDGAFTEMTFECYGFTPAPIYAGTVPLTVAGSSSGA